MVDDVTGTCVATTRSNEFSMHSQGTSPILHRLYLGTQSNGQTITGCGPTEESARLLDKHFENMSKCKHGLVLLR